MAYTENEFWQAISTYIGLRSAGADILLDAGTVLAFRDGNGSGSIDTIISRIAADVLGMTAGDAFRAGNYCEVAENTPGTPDSGFARFYSEATTGRPFYIDDSGVKHDLGCVGSQVICPGNNLTGTTGGGLCNVAAQAPGAAAPATGYASTIRCNMLDDDGTALPLDTAGNAGLLEYAYQELAWTSSAVMMNVNQYSAILGVPLHLFAADRGTAACTLARIVARVKLKPLTHFQSLTVALHDTPGTTNISKADIIGSMTNDTWYTYTSGLLDISSWTGPLRLTITANGQVANPVLVGAQQVCVEYVGIQLWAR